MLERTGEDDGELVVAVDEEKVQEEGERMNKRNVLSLSRTLTLIHVHTSGHEGGYRMTKK